MRHVEVIKRRLFSCLESGSQKRGSTLCFKLIIVDGIQYLILVCTMEKTSVKEALESPLIRSNHFLNWVKEQKDLGDKDPFQIYTKQFSGKKEGRLFFEGAFDVVHSGHYNALRQAKQICHTLVVGVNSDEGILIHKGPPVMNIKERCILVEACKWTDEVVGGTAYVPDIPLLDSVNCQCVGHGDDIIYGADGRSIYSDFEDVGRLK